MPTNTYPKRIGAVAAAAARSPLVKLFDIALKAPPAKTAQRPEMIAHSGKQCHSSIRNRKKQRIPKIYCFKSI